MCVQYIQCTCEISKNFKYFSFFRPFVLLFEIESEFEFAGSVDDHSILHFHGNSSFLANVFFRTRSNKVRHLLAVCSLKSL